MTAEREREWHASLGTRTLLLLACVVVLCGVPMLADHWVYVHVYRANVYDLDWGRFLRELGWLPTWLVVALALWLHGRGDHPDASTPPPGRRALYLALAPTAAGLLGEVLTLLLRRERPDVALGWYSFRAWSDRPFSTVGARACRAATPSSPSRPRPPSGAYSPGRNGSGSRWRPGAGSRASWRAHTF